jgi:hypothetical protein
MMEKFKHSFIELDDARFLEIELSVTAKDSWGDFKGKFLENVQILSGKTTVY